MKRPLALLLFLLFCFSSPGRPETVAVLPLYNASGKPAVEWIGVSAAEAIREALSEAGILALARDAVAEAHRRLGIRERALMTRASVIKIAETLDAEKVVFGSFHWIPAENGGGKNSLRFVLRVVDIPNMKQSPEFGHTAAIDDLAVIQNRLAWQTLRLLRPDSAPSEEVFLQSHPPARVDAIENYVRGLLATQAEQKHRFFTQAARLDQNYSRPRMALGRLLWEQENYKAAAEWFAKIQPTDSRYFEANFFLGLCRFYMGDYAGAQAAFETVVREVPLNEVFNNLGAAQSRRDRPEAVENFRKALEGDTSDPDYYFNLGYALWKRGEFAEAAQNFRAVLERDPEDAEAILMLGRCLKQAGPRASKDAASTPLERVKEEFHETAFRQLKEALERKSR
jgi:tetratricopeptide (TPR) repeat protein